MSYLFSGVLFALSLPISQHWKSLWPWVTDGWWQWLDPGDNKMKPVKLTQYQFQPLTVLATHERVAVPFLGYPVSISLASSLLSFHLSSAASTFFPAPGDANPLNSHWHHSVLPPSLQLSNTYRTNWLKPTAFSGFCWNVLKTAQEPCFFDCF